MSNEINFKNAFQLLKDKVDWKFSVQTYHHDCNSEPFYSAESDVERVVLDHVEEHGLIIVIMTPETMISFSEKNWLTHVGKDYVTFGSKHDDETHCIIEFC